MAARIRQPMADHTAAARQRQSSVARSSGDNSLPIYGEAFLFDNALGAEVDVALE